MHRDKKKKEICQSPLQALRKQYFELMMYSIKIMKV